MKFERPKGFMGSAPRNWIDKNLPRCPFCKLPSLWEVATKLGFFKLSRHYFRCPNCMVVFSIPVIATKSTIGAASAGLGGLLAKKKASHKLTVEDAGKNKEAEKYVGQEFSVKTLQEWARQIREGKDD